MGELEFWNIQTIGKNNRAQKIHTLGKITVTGVKINFRNPKGDFKKILHDNGFTVDLDYCDTIETLEMYSPSEFMDMEGNDVDLEDYDFISENWNYDKESNKIDFNYEFLIYEK